MRMRVMQDDDGREAVARLVREKSPPANEESRLVMTHSSINVIKMSSILDTNLRRDTCIDCKEGESCKVSKVTGCC